MTEHRRLLRPDGRLMASTVIAVEQLTPHLLSDLIKAPVASVDSTPLGIGNMSGSYRLQLRYAQGSDGPRTLIAKIASADPSVRATNVHTYGTEVGFYTQLASRVRCASPHCYYGATDEQDNSFLLLLEDLAPAEPGDQLRGCTVEEARAALVNLAGLHASTWGDPAFRNLPFLAPMGPETAAGARDFLTALLPGFIDRYGVEGDDAETLNAYADAVARCITGRTERFSLLHNDYRLDNLLFDSRPDSSRPVVAVDWAVLGTGLPGRDVAFFLATGLEPELRRAHERELVGGYNEALNSERRLQSPEETFDDYVYGLFHPVLITVLGAMLSQRSERGDRSFSTMIRRTCATIRDLNAKAVLP